MGTRAISGSPAIKFKNRTMAALLSSMASSMLMSMIWAPFSTCWRATAKACSKSPLRIMRANAFEPVTLVRSPMLTKREPGAMVKGSKPDKRMGAGEGRDCKESSGNVVMLIHAKVRVDERRCTALKSTPLRRRPGGIPSLATCLRRHACAAIATLLGPTEFYAQIFL